LIEQSLIELPGVVENSQRPVGGQLDVDGIDAKIDDAEQIGLAKCCTKITKKK
jgi:hypothetical protein